MNKTFDQGKDEVAKLCRYFATNRQSFLAPGIKEAHVRQSLIDPFFEALGWDMRNAAMVAPQYREVITEDSLEVEGQQKAPDYTFRLGTTPKFYVEAKKCGINLNADPGPAYQLRRYGFSAKLALSILTDFEELGVYECAARPRPGDKASHARVQYFGFPEYADRWREIWDMFSREAVWAGTFDQYAGSTRKRGTSEVDGEFLKDIEGWRDALARNLALRNRDLSADDLNAAVQRIIDRVIFLRMAEDRGLEPYGRLLKLCERPDIYARFISGLCRKADEKYNSGLFHFQPEPGVADVPDALTPPLAVDDKALKPILQSLYFEHGSPYNFGVLPVEILGTVYERFLGKVIRLTAGHQAKVEEKPEVRKAGGVYYTPAYIVNYIVLNTIGKQIEGKSPAALAGDQTAPPFRVLDMACGSGSFLLGAYQFLLDHCLQWHQANPSKKYAKAVYQNAKGETRLTIAERKRILTTHLFGVDIDRQAVETTKLSLLLKALEGENDATLSQQMSLFHERALPNLSDNIKCGNSLIASDFSMIPEDLVRVNAFDWPAQFPDAMKAGGFDAIIGNPPYVRQESLKEYKSYFQDRYEAFSGTGDLYTYFMERGVKLLKFGGCYSIIVSSSFLRATYAEALRETLRKHTAVHRIVDFGGLAVFTDAKDTYVCIPLLVRDAQPPKIEVGKVKTLDNGKVFDEMSRTEFFVPPEQLNRRGWVLKNEAEVALFNKLQSVGSCLGPLVGGRMYRGILTGMNDAFVISSDQRKTMIEKCSACETLIHSCRGGEDVREYFIKPSDSWLIVLPAGWTHTIMGSSASEEKASDWLEKQFPPIAEHLKPFKRQLQARQDRGDFWWELRPCDYYGVFTKPKIVFPDICKFPRFCHDDTGIYLTNTAYALGTGDKYLLGILNSRVFWFAISNISIPFGVRAGEFRYRLIYQYMEKVPIRVADLNNPAERAHHDRIVELVDKMLALTPKLRGATSESEKAALRNAVATTDAEIDRLVYELYGLTEEEIKIVEGAAK